MKKTYIFGFLVTLIILASYVVIVYFLSPGKAFRFIREDGIVENAEVLCYMVSACLLIYLFIRSKSDTPRFLFNTKMNWFYLLLGIFCILILGEEISWGQRIFDLMTPEKLQEAGGISLHNRDLFSLFGIQITAARIYFPIVLVYFVLVPVLNEYSGRMHRFFNRISLPVIPIFIAVFILFNFIIWLVAFSFFDFPERWIELPDYAFFQTAEEVYEINFALLLVWSCLSFYFKRTGKRSPIMSSMQKEDS